jgi:hypothetical protein
MAEKDRTQQREAPESGVIVNGINVKRMTQAELTAAAEAAANAGQQREVEFQRAITAYVNYRVVLAVLVFELDRRTGGIQLPPDAPPPGKLIT